MKLKTDSINEMLNIYSDGKRDTLTYEDLENVKYLTIRGFDIDNTKLNIDSDELNLFSNLEKLDICKCELDDKFVQNILNLDSLKEISINDSTFLISLDVLDKTLDKLSLYDVYGLDDTLINNVDTLIVRNTKLNRVGEFDINILDILKGFDTSKLRDVTYQVLIRDEAGKIVGEL